MSKLPHKDQFSGCLIGQCLGDALGFAVEGFSPRACKRFTGDFLRAGKPIDFGHFPFSFGQYSDDSQLARELIQSFVSLRQFDPSDYAKHIINIFMEKRIIGFGYATKEAAKRLSQGVSWEESGAPPPSAGNGSAMRSAPVGLFFFNDPKSLIRAAYDQGRITHKDPRCAAGAVAISGSVSLVLQNKNIIPEAFLLTLSEWTGTFDREFAKLLMKLVDWLSLPPSEAAALISKAGISPDYVQEVGWPGISPFVVSSVLWSLYAFLRSPDDYFETICTAIEVGGDVDTTAAMAGAISGAYLGIGAVPSHLSEPLNDRNTWGFDELVQLAHECHKIAVSAA
jgi:ADP-ribosylglycohydrolase